MHMHSHKFVNAQDISDRIYKKLVAGMENLKRVMLREKKPVLKGYIQYTFFNISEMIKL